MVKSTSNPVDDLWHAHPWFTLIGKVYSGISLLRLLFVKTIPPSDWWYKKPFSDGDKGLVETTEHPVTSLIQFSIIGTTELEPRRIYTDTLALFFVDVVTGNPNCPSKKSPPIRENCAYRKILPLESLFHAHSATEIESRLPLKSLFHARSAIEIEIESRQFCTAASESQVEQLSIILFMHMPYIHRRWIQRPSQDLYHHRYATDYRAFAPSGDTTSV
jgi:hypothetical protein